MVPYLVLFRGINVGGKNKVPMAELKKCLEELGFTKVVTYIASGNVILESRKKPSEVQDIIQHALPHHFSLDSDLIKVLVLTKDQLQNIVDHKPSGFGDEPTKYHTDVIFLMDTTVDEALPVFKPREGVDVIWPGERVIYSQRLSAQRTKSRLSAIMSSPLYKSMTIRTWNTTVKLLALMLY